MEKNYQPRELSVRVINNETGDVINEFMYTGYFDITKRDLRTKSYMVKNGKNIFLNGVHINEIRKVIRKVNENQDSIGNIDFSEIEQKALKLAPIFTKYNTTWNKIKMIEDIKSLLHMSKDYVKLTNRKSEKVQANSKEDIQLADKVVELAKNLKEKQAV